MTGVSRASEIVTTQPDSRNVPIVPKRVRIATLRRMHLLPRLARPIHRVLHEFLQGHELQG